GRRAVRRLCREGDDWKFYLRGPATVTEPCPLRALIRNGAVCSGGSCCTSSSELTRPLPEDRWISASTPSASSRRTSPEPVFAVSAPAAAPETVRSPLPLRRVSFPDASSSSPT